MTTAAIAAAAIAAAGSPAWKVVQAERLRARSAPDVARHALSLGERPSPTAEDARKLRRLLGELHNQLDDFGSDPTPRQRTALKKKLDRARELYAEIASKRGAGGPGGGPDDLDSRFAGIWRDLQRAIAAGGPAQASVDSAREALGQALEHRDAISRQSFRFVTILDGDEAERQ